jgi:hypothetical protein
MLAGVPSRFRSQYLADTSADTGLLAVTTRWCAGNCISQRPFELRRSLSGAFDVLHQAFRATERSGLTFIIDVGELIIDIWDSHWTCLDGLRPVLRLG